MTDTLESTHYLQCHKCKCKTDAATILKESDCLLPAPNDFNFTYSCASCNNGKHHVAPTVPEWCHQCKQKNTSIVRCRDPECPKKYCTKCIARHYNETPENTNFNDWTCAFCRRVCTCAMCRKNRAKNVSVVKKAGTRASTEKPTTPSQKPKRRPDTEIEEEDGKGSPATKRQKKAPTKPYLTRSPSDRQAESESEVESLSESDPESPITLKVPALPPDVVAKISKEALSEYARLPTSEAIKLLCKLVEGTQERLQLENKSSPLVCAYFDTMSACCRGIVVHLAEMDEITRKPTFRGDGETLPH